MAKEPASIRYKNPGAQWPGPVSKKFGSTKYVVLKDGQSNKIAVFDTFEAGAAAQFYLWATKYTGMTLEAAIKKWSGHNSSKSYADHMKKKVGISMSDMMTREYLAGPDGWKFMKAQAQWEAGKVYPMTDKQWQAGQELAFGKPENPAPDIRDVQKRLDALGYHEVGVVDGKWGGKTAAAIAGFKNDRHMSGEPVIDDALLAEMDKAESEGWKRPIAVERSEATEATVAKQAPEIVPVKRSRFAAFWAAITSAALAVINALADYFKDALAWVVGLKEYAADAPAWLWFVIAGAVALVIWFAAKNGAKGIVEAFRKGERS